MTSLLVGDCLRLVRHRDGQNNLSYVYNEQRGNFVGVEVGDMFVVASIRPPYGFPGLQQYECTVRLLHMSGFYCLERMDALMQDFELVE